MKNGFVDNYIHVEYVKYLEIQSPNNIINLWEYSWKIFKVLIFRIPT